MNSNNITCSHCNDTELIAVTEEQAKTVYKDIGYYMALGIAPMAKWPCSECASTSSFTSIKPEKFKLKLISRTSSSEPDKELNKSKVDKPKLRLV